MDYARKISRDIFDRVQEERSRRKSLKRVSDKTATNLGKYSSKYALSNILICGECYTPYRRKTWENRDGSLEAVWRCISRLDHGTRYCKHSPTLREDKLHQTITNAMTAILGEQNNLVPLLNTHLEKAMWQVNTREEVNIDEMEKQIKSLKLEVNELLTRCIADNSVMEHESQFVAINEEISVLHQKLKCYKENETTKAGISQKLKEYTDFLQVDTRRNAEYSDTLVRQMIHTIKIDGENLIIYFKSGTTWTQPLAIVEAI